MNKLIKPLSLPAFLCAALFTGPVLANTAGEITQLIKDDNTYTMKNLKSPRGGIPKAGSHQFWSSGGLLQHIPADVADAEFESFGLQPKHIEVITLEEGKFAVAMYYSEGSFHPKGSDKVSHYFTRVTEVYIKEDGNWKVRASHYSPVTGGSGTSQTSVD